MPKHCEAIEEQHLLAQYMENLQAKEAADAAARVARAEAFAGVQPSCSSGGGDPVASVLMADVKRALQGGKLSILVLRS